MGNCEFLWFREEKEETYQENNNLLDQLELAALVIPALQHLSWLYVDMPESSTGAGASWARKSLAPAFRARPSTLYFHQFSNPFTFCAFSQVDKYWVWIDGHLYTSNKIQHIIQLPSTYHTKSNQAKRNVSTCDSTWNYQEWLWMPVTRREGVVGSGDVAIWARRQCWWQGQDVTWRSRTLVAAAVVTWCGTRMTLLLEWLFWALTIREMRLM